MTLDDLIAELEALRQQTGLGHREVFLQGDGAIDKVVLDSDAVTVTGLSQHIRFGDGDDE